MSFRSGKGFVVSGLAGIVLLLCAAGAAAQALPPVEADAKARLLASPRHGEWVKVDAGGGDIVDTWVVYPERPDRAPVVLVVHEIFGLSDWARAVADQLAAEGFIAVAPDFLSGKGPGGGGTASMDPEAARRANSSLDPAEVYRRLNAAARYATSLPAALPKYGVVGFCWGGGISFGFAAEQPRLSAAVVFYGVSPSADALQRVKAPVLGLYGGSDARVDATIPAAEAELKRLGRRYEKEIFEGAGHAFMRLQDGQNGANLKAAQAGWPRMVRFFRQAFGEGVSLGVPGTGGRPESGAAAQGTGASAQGGGASLAALVSGPEWCCGDG
jgi:carboxymethylenebutenolidase